MIMVLAVASLMAQAPEKFSYQAVVRNASNVLVTNAPVSVRVSILQGSADGQALYVETHSAVTNANGLLTVEIGGGKAEQGEFDRIDWADGPYFLMTETDPNGGGNYSITSTQQLLSVPYALYAKEAANSFSGDYNDLKNKPAIPQNVGDLTNDAGYITLSDLPNPPKGGGEVNSNDEGIIYTTECGEINLCELAQMRTVLLPTVTTGNVSRIIETEATCIGAVMSNGYSEVTARGVCWSTEPNPNVAGNHTTEGSGIGEFTRTLTDLQPNTTYYVKAYATNSIGTAYGEEVNFTTAEHDTCATISLPYSEDFEGYTTSTTLETGVQPECWKLIAEDVALTNATKPQLYRGYATSGSYSLRMKNRCIYAMPALDEEIDIRDLTMSFNLRQPNSAYRLQVGVVDEYGEFTLVKTIKCSGTGVEAKTVSFSNYTGTGHRIAFRNTLVQGYTLDYSVNYIDDITINGTVSATLPMVITGTVSEITATTAICGGEVTADGGAEVIGRGVCWSTEPNPTVEGNYTSDGTGTGEFISTLASLQPNTTYYVRSYATNSEGTAYGEEMTFTTAEEQQAICAINALPFTEDFESYTTSTTTETGIQPDCWEVTTEDVALTNATKPQLYRGFATSGSYSLRMKNRCVYAMPVLREDVSVRDLTMTFNLRQPNSAYRLQVGVVDESGAFTLVKTIKCSGTGIEAKTVDFTNYTGTGHRIAFRNTLVQGSSLDYSINYIDDITITLLGSVVVDEKSCSGTPTVTDIDGNTYSTVKIGEQCWMRENLKTTHYADGVEIPAGNDSVSSTIAYRYCPNNNANNVPIYGYLYNWPAVMHGENSSAANPSGVQGICPVGWHMPSDAEWTQLTNFVGSQAQYVCGDTNANIAKALAATTRWSTHTATCAVGNNLEANNSTGFSILPAGQRGGGLGSGTHLWSATYSRYGAWCRLLQSENPSVVRTDWYYGGSPENGYSVRCLRNESEPISSNILPCTGAATVTDYDGNVYNTVQIGQQCWMRENLRTAHYADGVEILAGNDSVSSTIAYRYCPNNNANNVPIYGYLYNWPAVMHGENSSAANPSGVQGICPVGWHMPSDAEWTQLTNFVGSQAQYVCGDTNANIAKALAATTRWSTHTATCAVGNNLEANNSTGFSILPAGQRGGGLGSGTHLWSATYSRYGAWCRLLQSENPSVVRTDWYYGGSPENGYSVRCLRD